MTSVKTELPAKREATLPAETGPVDITRLMQFALEHSKTEDLERLVAMQERREAKDAERQFAEALSEFQAMCPPLKKTKKVDYTSRAGARIKYNFTPLDRIAMEIGPLMRQCGFSFSHDSVFTDTDIDCTVTLMHRAGHSRTARFKAPLETVSTAMNAQQRNANALAYARRYSLIQALGITTTDDDIENGDELLAVITDGQAADLAALVDEVSVNVKEPTKVLPRLLKYAGVERIADIKVARYGELVAMLNGMRGAKK